MSARISDANPMGTDGFEFLEFSGGRSGAIEELFESFGFVATAKHRTKKVTLFKQGDINFIVNREPNSYASQFAEKHGPCACSFALRVADADYALKRALALGATAGPLQHGPTELTIPSIVGIGGCLLYLIDKYGDNGTVYDMDFIPIDQADKVSPSGINLTLLDHVTHNVYRGNMDKWAEFYERLFNFREIRYFDIEGKLTGLKSKAMTSPCGKIRIPINESSDDISQIEEFLKAYNGEGIQHIALASTDIYKTVEVLQQRGVNFMAPPPDTYYDMLSNRLPWHNENAGRLKALAILMDGAPTKDGGLLLQIFTETEIGPIFFEIIQRKGDEGFGEGNFQALFESIEQDQLRRGVLNETSTAS